MRPTDKPSLKARQRSTEIQGLPLAGDWGHRVEKSVEMRAVGQLNFERVKLDMFERLRLRSWKNKVDITTGRA